MAAKVTIQDIADALGLSRNTVSKAINNTGILADATRDKVLQKAAEMGYKQFSYASYSQAVQSHELPMPGEKREIALLTTSFLGNSHFASVMLDKFQREIAQMGYSLSMHRVLPEEIKSFQFPITFRKEQVAGIICVEMFNYDYCKMLTEQDIPVLFADTPVIGLRDPLKADCLYMDNTSHIHTFVREMVRRGKKSIGFIGEYQHCQSFFERYMAYRNAMYLSGLTCPEQFCLIDQTKGLHSPTYTCYRDYLRDAFSSMNGLPDVFICANDFNAIDVLDVMNEFGISVPRDVYLCGFDDSPESKLITPQLTTIHIHTQIMGFSAAQLMMSRIKEPSLNYRTIYAETDIVYRASTED